MPRAVPLAFLAAEAEAWPLVSPGGFRRRTTRLARRRGNPVVETQALADELEAHLRLRAGGMSLAVLRQLRDDAWFRRDEDRTAGLHDEVALSTYAMRLARRSLERRGPQVILRNALEPYACATAWRWLSFSLPQDLLVAALFAADGDEPTTDHVTLVTPHLARVLEDEVALTHLHVGAAFSFSCLWTMLMRSLATNPPTPGELRASSDDVPLGGPEPFVRMLAAAALSRLILARFLMDDGVGAPTFAGSWHRRLDAMTSAVTSGWAGRLGATMLDRAVRCLALGDVSTSRHELLFLYRSLVGAETSHGARRPLPHRDPLAGWLRPVRGVGLCETRFAARALRHLSARPDDRGFATLFWQYQWVRNLVYRFVVAEPLTAGMDWFQRHYDRINSLRKGLDPDLYRIALEFESGDIGLASLEVRTRPDAGWAGIRDQVRRVAEQARAFEGADGARRPEVGLVLHFIKRRDCAPGCRPQADPRHAAFSARFGPWFSNAMAQASAIATALDFHPELLLVLRGIDVASLELEGPTWALCPVFRRVNAAARRAADRLAVRRPGWQVSTLRHTLHVGEDFRRLVDGIRRMHEPIEFGLLGMGDRIGHGLALGLDPARWCAASASVPQPAEERLDDLLWELERYRRGDWSPSTQRLEYVKSEILELATGIYDSEEHVPGALTLQALIRARRYRHSPALLRWLGYPAPDWRLPAAPGSAYQLLHRYLTDARVFERGQSTVHVPVDSGEIEMLTHAQSWLRGVLARLEITIESNPSSNLMVADLSDLDEHPLLRLQAAALPPAAGPATVMVSINDDDPVSFATRLSDEFAYVYYALLRRGLPSQEALQYVDRLRANGWRSRFTLQASADPDALDDLLAQLGCRRVHANPAAVPAA